MDEQEVKKRTEELLEILKVLQTKTKPLKSKLAFTLDQDYALFREDLDILEEIAAGDLETEAERRIAKRCMFCVVSQIKLNQIDDTEIESE